MELFCKILFFFGLRPVAVVSQAVLDGKNLRRAFCQFIMDPICELCQSIMAEKNDKAPDSILS